MSQAGAASINIYVVPVLKGYRESLRNRPLTVTTMPSDHAPWRGIYKVQGVYHASIFRAIAGLDLSSIVFVSAIESPTLIVSCFRLRVWTR